MIQVWTEFWAFFCPVSVNVSARESEYDCISSHMSRFVKQSWLLILNFMKIRYFSGTLNPKVSHSLCSCPLPIRPAPSIPRSQAKLEAGNTPVRKRKNSSRSTGEGKKSRMLSTGPPKTSKRLYCVCKTAYDETKFYIGCDICSNWFHGRWLTWFSATMGRFDLLPRYLVS